MKLTPGGSRDQYDLRYMERSFDLRVPGDAMKDRIICRAIQETDYQGKRLLDLGCGMGHTTTMLAELVDAVGIDFSAAAIGIARGNAKGEFVCGGVEQLPFSDNTFDYVIAKDLLEHVPDDGKVLEEISRVCRQCAVVILYLPCALDGINFSSEAIVKRLTGYTLDPAVGHLRRYTPAQAIELLRSSGFADFRLWFFVHYTLGIASLASVLGQRLLSYGKGERTRAISNAPLFLLRGIFWLFQFFGSIEARALKKLPGAGFFLIADAGQRGPEVRRPNAGRPSNLTSEATGSTNGPDRQPA